MNTPEAAQNTALRLLLPLPSLRSAKLLGGTALARCYLKHRVSYDLDFFLPEGFDPNELAVSMKAAGIRAKPLEIVKDASKANQWHGFLVLPEGNLKVSFIQDSYYDVFAAVNKNLDGILVKTETVEGLFHRKLLTVSHPSPDGKTATGGRQTARDLFDLWVLSQAVMPIRKLIASLPYDYPEDAFIDGLDGMPWFDLSSDLAATLANKKWAAGKDVEIVRKYLYAQFGIKIEMGEGDINPDASGKPRKPAP